MIRNMILGAACALYGLLAVQAEAQTLTRTVALPYNFGNSTSQLNLPSCKATQALGVSGSAMVCRDMVTVPTCAKGQLLAVSGTTLACASNFMSTGWVNSPAVLDLGSPTGTWLVVANGLTCAINSVYFENGNGWTSLNQDGSCNWLLAITGTPAQGLAVHVHGGSTAVWGAATGAPKSNMRVLINTNASKARIDAIRISE
jgi:hypothetical protein